MPHNVICQHSSAFLQRLARQRDTAVVVHRSRDLFFPAAVCPLTKAAFPTMIPLSASEKPCDNLFFGVIGRAPKVAVETLRTICPHPQSSSSQP